MKWQMMTKEETGGCDIAYIYGGDFDRTVEISYEKNKYTVRCYKETLFREGTKSFKTLSAAKRHANKWFNEQIDITMKALKKLKAQGVSK